MSLISSQPLLRALLICALIIGSSFGDNEGDDDHPIKNETIPVPVHIKPPGSPEELRPNLVGLANMAIFYLPQSLNFKNVLKATREIVNGVRYELIVNTKDNENNEIICAIVILEKPWITTEWGDKLRILKNSNCSLGTDEATPFNPGDQYEGNTLFNRANTVLTHGDLSDLEAQILAAKKKKNQLEDGNNEISNSKISGIESQILAINNDRKDKTSTTRKPNVENIQVDSGSLETTTPCTTSASNDANRYDFSEGSLAFLDSIFSVQTLSTENTALPETKETTVPCPNNPSIITPVDESTTKNIPGNSVITESTISYSTSTQSTTTTTSDEKLDQKDFSEDSKGLLESMFMSNGIGVVILKPTITEIIEPEHKVVRKPAPNNLPSEIDATITKQPSESQQSEPSSSSSDYEKSTRRKRQDNSYIKMLAQKAILQLNENYKRNSSLLEVLDYNRANVSSDEDYYIITARLLYDNNDCELFLMDAKPKKLCSFEVSVKSDSGPQLAQSQCFDEDNNRDLVGGASRVPENKLDEVKRLVSESLASLKDCHEGDGPVYEKLVKINCATMQVVSGVLYKVSAQFEDNNKDNNKKDTVNCVMEIWSQPWKSSPNQVTVKCDEELPEKKSVSSCNLPLVDRTKRNARPLVNPEEFAYVKKIVDESIPLKEIERSRGKPFYKKIKKVICATELYIDDEKYYQLNGEFDLNNGSNKNCVLTLVEPTSGRNIVTLKCDRIDEVYRYEYYPSILTIPHNKKTKEQRLFAKFLRKYNKSYGHTLEELNRYKIFLNNLYRINILNKMEQGTAKYGLTEFSDLTADEYHQRTGLLFNAYETDNFIRNPLAEIPQKSLPKTFDWRDKGVITKVKNQGNCGSCWAFSVTGNIEGLHAIKSGKLEEYSEQELLDCDTVDKACSGGLPDNAYKALETIGGLELENEYPYKAKQSKCSFNKTMSHAQVKGAIDFPKNETAMALWLVANGPISIGINANGMQFYRGGISHPWRPLCRHGQLDHGVLIVGFGIAEYPVFNKTLPYWIVKNSWGESWGERGYYRVFRGDNTCGISEMASSAVLYD